ncbi:2og-fe oxygenase family [Cystoisospora suis]|uniref:2og-fe oxygenase family n=1 Tax=Cystoisospora suis TaxID=483139 RepID=A0A2C6KJ82_9APIC|nr:2og-fe oxygenase family [Cystoisospora suis]
MKGRWRKDKRSDPTLQGSAVVTLSSPSASPPIQKPLLSTSSLSSSTVSSLSSPSPHDSSVPQENTQDAKTAGSISCEEGGALLSHKKQLEEMNVAMQKKDRNWSVYKGPPTSQSNPSSSSSPEYLQDTTSFFSRQRMAQLAKQQSASEGIARNAGALYACQSLKKSSEFALCDTETHAAFKKALDGGSIYLPEFCCKREDMTLFNRLFQDLLQYASQLEAKAKETLPPDDNPKKEVQEEEESFSSSSSSFSTSPHTSSSLPSFPSSSASSALPFLGAVNWSRHLKHENPSFSSTFCKIIEKLSAYFDVEVYATRLNLYMDHTHWKPLHKDSHAYSSVTNQTEDITVGASFGASRELEFVHDQNSEFRFVFPQHNGDVFAFNSEINQLFKHGVPKGEGNIGKERGGGEGVSSNISRGKEESCQKTNRGNTARFSIILWGRRKKLTERNASKSELARQSRYEDRSYR